MPNCKSVTVRVNEKVASYLNNQRRKAINDLESEGKMRIEIRGSDTVYPEHLEMDCRDDRGNQVPMPKYQ